MSSVATVINFGTLYLAFHRPSCVQSHHSAPSILNRKWLQQCNRRFLVHLPQSRKLNGVINCRSTCDPELHSVLELASDSELYDLQNILFGPSYFSPLLKSLTGRSRVDHVMISDDLDEREEFISMLESRFLYLAADARSTLRDAGDIFIERNENTTAIYMGNGLNSSYLTNGYLDQVLDWVPGMKGIRLKDLPSFIRTTDPEEYMVKFAIQETDRARKASAVILNTFEELEHDVLEALSSLLPSVFCIGPLQFLEHQVTDESLSNLGSNLWKEEHECLKWLDLKDVNSVVYVNFGSITVMSPDQLVEFAWGLAHSNQTFLWVIRPDLVIGDSAIVPPEFLEETNERGLLAGWCPQEHVLNHPSIGGFLTHNGWNSTLESISSGVPMICWPFFAEQQTNCWYCCTQWGIGMEIRSDVKRDDVEGLVKELMIGKKGLEMKKKALDWKMKVEKAIRKDQGSSNKNVQKLIHEVLLSRGQQGL